MNLNTDYYSIFFSNSKIILHCVALGTFKDSPDDAIVSLTKTPFTEEKVKSILTKDTSMTKEFSNDIYGNFIAETKPNLNSITTSTIHPATQKHIMKFTSQNIYLLNETADDYLNITLPFLQKQQFSIDVSLHTLTLINDKFTNRINTL